LELAVLEHQLRLLVIMAVHQFTEWLWLAVVLAVQTQFKEAVVLAQ